MHTDMYVRVLYRRIPETGRVGPIMGGEEVELRLDSSTSPSKPNDSIRSSAAVVPPRGSANLVCEWINSQIVHCELEYNTETVNKTSSEMLYT